LLAQASHRGALWKFIWFIYHERLASKGNRSENLITFRPNQPNLYVICKLETSHTGFPGSSFNQADGCAEVSGLNFIPTQTERLTRERKPIPLSRRFVPIAMMYLPCPNIATHTYHSTTNVIRTSEATLPADLLPHQDGAAPSSGIVADRLVHYPRSVPSTCLPTRNPTLSPQTTYPVCLPVSQAPSNGYPNTPKQTS